MTLQHVRFIFTEIIPYIHIYMGRNAASLSKTQEQFSISLFR